MSFVLKSYYHEIAYPETVCTAFSLEKEIYSPLASMSAVFLSTQNYQGISRVELYFQEKLIFRGFCHKMEKFSQNGREFFKISAHSFSSVLTQNQVEKGLHSNVTLSNLVYDYSFPWVTCENNATTGYIFVKDGSLWDSIVSFGYKITFHHPFVINNEVRISPPSQDWDSYSVNSSLVLSQGSFFDSSKLVSHFHMEGLDETPNAYQRQNLPSITANIIRHKQIPFDREFLHDPDSALVFRCLHSLRGYQGKFFSYSGFQGEELGERISVGNFLNDAVICDIKVTYGANGLVTKIRCYQDGFYSC